MYVEIESVGISDWDGLMDAGYRQRGQTEDRFTIETKVGGVYDFAKFFTIVPEKAKFSELEFVYSNASAVKVENGKIHVLQNMRSSDRQRDGSVTIEVNYGEKQFYIIYVEIKVDRGSFDYFGFDYDMLKQGASDPVVAWSKYCAVNNGYLIISKQDLGGTVIPDFGRILRDGFDTAPYDLLYNQLPDGSPNPDRAALLNSLAFPDKPGILAITSQGQDANDINIFAAEILGTGITEITVTADWKGAAFIITINIEVV